MDQEQSSSHFEDTQYIDRGVLEATRRDPQLQQTIVLPAGGGALSETVSLVSEADDHGTEPIIGYPATVTSTNRSERELPEGVVWLDKQDYDAKRGQLASVLEGVERDSMVPMSQEQSDKARDAADIVVGIYGNTLRTDASVLPELNRSINQMIRLTDNDEGSRSGHRLEGLFLGVNPTVDEVRAALDVIRQRVKLERGSSRFVDEPQAVFRRDVAIEGLRGLDALVQAHGGLHVSR